MKMNSEEEYDYSEDREDQDIIDAGTIPSRDLGAKLLEGILNPATSFKELHKDYGISNISKDLLPKLWSAMLFYKQLDMLPDHRQKKGERDENYVYLDDDENGSMFNVEKAKKFFLFVPELMIETTPSINSKRAELFMTNIIQQKIEKFTSGSKEKKKRLMP